MSAEMTRTIEEINHVYSISIIRGVFQDLHAAVCSLDLEVTRDLIYLRWKERRNDEARARINQ